MPLMMSPTPDQLWSHVRTSRSHVRTPPGGAEPGRLGDGHGALPAAAADAAHLVLVLGFSRRGLYGRFPRRRLEAPRPFYGSRTSRTYQGITETAISCSRPSNRRASSGIVDRKR